MGRGQCRRHGSRVCSCSMGNLYRYVEPVILYLLKVKGKIHGYELTKALNENSLTDSIIESGALYRTLRRLEENGKVSSDWDVTKGGPARRVYELTSEGEIHLKEWKIVLNNLSKSMAKFVKDVEDLVDEVEPS